MNSSTLLTFSSSLESDSRLNLYLSINLRRSKICDKLVLYKTVNQPPISGAMEMSTGYHYLSIYRATWAYNDCSFSATFFGTIVEFEQHISNF